MKRLLQVLLSLALTFKVTSVSAASHSYKAEQLISRYVSWGIDPDKHLASINLINSWKKFKKKKNVIVAVVDTGIEAEHPFLKNNIHVIQGKPSKNNFGIDFSAKKLSPEPTDHHGHGTHIAGIVKSVFPEVKILSLKYYNPQASGKDNLTATLKALKYAIDSNVDIINYSGGGPEPLDEELSILKEAEAKGILIVAAAGNKAANIDNYRHAFYPASYGLSNIITVGAHDDSLNIIPSSNYGMKTVDIAAPGYRIRSSIPGKGSGYMTGTSQATAFVTGVAALIKAKHPEMKFEQIKNVILSSSLRVKSFEGKVSGGKKLDAHRAITLADSLTQKSRRKHTRKIANK